MDRRKATFAAALTSIVLASPALAANDSSTTTSEWTFADVFFAATSVAGYVQTAANVVDLLTGVHADAEAAASPSLEEAADQAALAATVEMDAIGVESNAPNASRALAAVGEVTPRVPAQIRAVLGPAAHSKFIWVASTPRLAERCAGKTTSRRVTEARFAQANLPVASDRLVVYRIATSAVAQVSSTARCR